MAKAVRTSAKRMLADNSYSFLRNYINTPSPTGFESGGQKVWLNYIKPFVDEIMTDPYGTAVGIINPQEKFKVVIEAHADEISWFVNYISESGLIYLKRNGGVDHQIAPGKRVFIHGKKGPVKAVFGWPAIHTRIGGGERKDPQPAVDNLFLDCGAKNRKQVESLGIHIGRI
jgi:putative aminopeptidase FrvX